MYYKSEKEVKKIHKKYRCSKKLKKLMILMVMRRSISKVEHQIILKACGKNKIVDSSELDKYER